jgi:hypothetical protein
MQNGVSSWVESVAKLGRPSEMRNKRIGADGLLNQYCALALDVESILRWHVLKIVLQKNRVSYGRDVLALLGFDPSPTDQELLFGRFSSTPSLSEWSGIVAAKPRLGKTTV